MLEGVELFDAAFFGFSPREAAVLDPQHRIFLECAWEALETSGHDPERFEGPIGVYAGAGMSGYLLFNLLAGRRFPPTAEAFQILIGNDKDYLTTRVSYKLNLKGPSVAVQTACSTSLVAVHLACQSLLTYQCDMALAGGISVRVPQKAGHFYQPERHPVPGRPLPRVRCRRAGNHLRQRRRHRRVAAPGRCARGR